MEINIGAYIKVYKKNNLTKISINTSSFRIGSQQTNGKL